MQKVNNQWGIDLAHRLGLGGTVERVHTAEGATLHIKCSGGRSNSPHVVDVKIRPNLDPNGTAKQMLNRGWTLGRRKIICPDCGRRTKPAKAAKRRDRQATVAEMTLPVIPPEVTPAPPEKPVATDRFAKARARITPEQRREFGRKGGLAREANRLKREEERLRQQGRIPAAPCPTIKPVRISEVLDALPGETIMQIHDTVKTIKEKQTMATQEQGATPTASDRARIAKREALDTLALAFKMAPDGKSGVYESGYSDARIAKETGLAESKIKEMREEFYGPLGEPDELRELKDALIAGRNAIDAAEKAWQAELARIQRKFEALATRMGWPVA